MSAVYTNIGLWLESPHCIIFTASLLDTCHAQRGVSVCLFVCLSNKLENVYFIIIIIIIMTCVYNYGFLARTHVVVADDDDMWSQSASDQKLVDVMRSHEFHQHQDPSWPSDRQLLVDVLSVERGHIFVITQNKLLQTRTGALSPVVVVCNTFAGYVAGR